jgi:hypothetical protein
MTSQEFVLWLKGFSEGVHEYNITPKQWDIVKEKLTEVKDEPTQSIPFGVPNNTPFVQPFHHQPYYPNPWDEPGVKYKVTCEDNSGVILTTSSGSGGTTITTTPGIGGTITYNPSTTTQWNPSGSNWSYTNNTGNNKWSEYQATMAHYKPYQPYTTGGPDEVIKTEE